MSLLCPLALTGRGPGWAAASLSPQPWISCPPSPSTTHFWNESLSSLEEGASGSTPPSELLSPSASSLGPVLPPVPGDA